MPHCDGSFVSLGRERQKLDLFFISCHVRMRGVAITKLPPHKCLLILGLSSKRQIEDWCPVRWARYQQANCDKVAPDYFTAQKICVCLNFLQSDWISIFLGIHLYHTFPRLYFLHQPRQPPEFSQFQSIRNFQRGSLPGHRQLTFLVH